MGKIAPEREQSFFSFSCLLSRKLYELNWCLILSPRTCRVWVCMHAIRTNGSALGQYKCIPCYATSACRQTVAHSRSRRLRSPSICERVFVVESYGRNPIFCRVHPFVSWALDSHPPVRFDPDEHGTPRHAFPLSLPRTAEDHRLAVVPHWLDFSPTAEIPEAGVG